jgi:hypothetical protein
MGNAAALEAPWVVLGPRNDGSNYGLLSISDGTVLTATVRELLNDYALTTLAAAPLQRRYLSFFRLGEDDAPWLLAQTSTGQQTARGVERITWGLLLSQAQLDVLRFQLAPLIARFPRDISPPRTPPPPLRWTPDSKPPAVPTKQIVSVSHIARALPVLLSTPSWTTPEDVALGVVGLAYPITGLNFATRADLEPRGDLARLPRTAVVTFAGDDPPADWRRYDGYQAMRLGENRELFNAPQIPEGERSWNAVLDNVSAQFTEGERALGRLFDVVVAENAEDAPAFIAAKIARIARGLEDERTESITGLTALLFTLFKMAEQSGSSWLVTAADAGFRKAMPADPTTAARYIDFYIDSVERRIGKIPQRAKWSVDLAAERGLLLRLSHDSLEVIAPDLFTRPQLLDLSLKSPGRRPEALRFLMANGAARLRDHPDATLAKVVAALFDGWAALSAADRNCTENMPAVMHALARPDYRGMLAQSLRNKGATALRETYGATQFHDLMRGLAREALERGQDKSKTKIELYGSLLLTVQLSSMQF